MVRSRTVALAALAALSLVVLGGCGDGSLGASELRAQAGTICGDTATVIALIPVPSTADAGARYLREGAAELRPTVAQLRRLKPPQGLRASYEQAVRLGAREITLIERGAREIGAGEDPVSTFRTLQQRLEPLTQVEDATWRALEVPACVRR